MVSLSVHRRSNPIGDDMNQECCKGGIYMTDRFGGGKVYRNLICTQPPPLFGGRKSWADLPWVSHLQDGRGPQGVKLRFWSPFLLKGIAGGCWPSPFQWLAGNLARIGSWSSANPRRKTRGNILRYQVCGLGGNFWISSWFYCISWNCFVCTFNLSKFVVFLSLLFLERMVMLNACWIFLQNLPAIREISTIG